MIDTLIRIVAPKRAERRRIAKLAKQARPKAWRDAYELCAAAGPTAIASEYGIWRGQDLRTIADIFVSKAYRKEVRRDALDGARAGFAAYAERNS